jgi:hypothetical protein
VIIQARADHPDDCIIVIAFWTAPAKRSDGGAFPQLSFRVH